MREITIGMYFFVILLGIFGGLYIGFSIRSCQISCKEKKYYCRNYMRPQKTRTRKKMKAFRKNRRKQKETAVTLKNRIPETESYTHFLCDSIGEDSSEHIEQIRRSQDRKYVNKIKK